MARAKRFCPIEDCGRPAYGNGLCSLHYQRLKRNGTFDLGEQPRHGKGPHLPLPPHISREMWLAYSAGFVDGEGCIVVQYRKSSRTHYLKITVPQLNPAPLHILQSLFGGSVRLKAGRVGNYRRLWIWEAAARQAAEAIAALRPYLTVKAEEADIAIDFQAGIGRAYSGGVSDDERARRDAAKRRLEELKARSYP
jgi:hypothetical protein